MPANDPYCYLAAEYYATGEGMTTCLYVSRCYDLKEEINSFKHRFGFYAEHFEVYDRQRFFDQYKRLISPHVIVFIETKTTPPGFCWFCEYHFNYS